MRKFAFFLYIELCCVLRKRKSIIFLGTCCFKVCCKHIGAYCSNWLTETSVDLLRVPVRGVFLQTKWTALMIVDEGARPFMVLICHQKFQCGRPRKIRQNELDKINNQWSTLALSWLEGTGCLKEMPLPSSGMVQTSTISAIDFNTLSFSL